MIPAKATCPPNWTMEYFGYLMSEADGHRRANFVCVDADQEPIPGTLPSVDGALFYHVEGSCNYGLACPPFNTEQELNCVVCTK